MANSHRPGITTDQPPAPEQHGSRAPHGYEETDVDAKPVVISGAILLVLSAVAALLMAVFLGVMTAPWATSIGAARTREAAPESLPGPDSAAYPIEDWRRVQSDELRRLHEPGWVDKGRGVVRIPIDDAMRITMQRGLPTRPSPAPSPGGVR